MFSLVCRPRPIFLETPRVVPVNLAMIRFTKSQCTAAAVAYLGQGTPGWGIDRVIAGSYHKQLLNMLDHVLPRAHADPFKRQSAAACRLIRVARLNFLD
jgi:hypothetical protein